MKPNTLSEFTRTFDKEVIPMLRKQSGFRDEITLAITGGLDVVAAGYPEVLKIPDNPNTEKYRLDAAEISAGTGIWSDGHHDGQGQTIISICGLHIC